MSAKALIEFRDVIRVWIEFRAPKKGELMWSVPAELTPEEALEHVVVGRDDWASGECGFGYRAPCDQPALETCPAISRGSESEERLRNIVVHVEWVRSEPQLSNVLPYIKPL